MNYFQFFYPWSMLTPTSIRKVANIITLFCNFFYHWPLVGWRNWSKNKYRPFFVLDKTTLYVFILNRFFDHRKLVLGRVSHAIWMLIKVVKLSVFIGFINVIHIAHSIFTKMYRKQMYKILHFLQRIILRKIYCFNTLFQTIGVLIVGAGKPQCVECLR